MRGLGDASESAANHFSNPQALILSLSKGEDRSLSPPTPPDQQPTPTLWRAALDRWLGTRPSL